jgi:hypothetical protein
MSYLHLSGSTDLLQRKKLDAAVAYVVNAQQFKQVLLVITVAHWPSEPLPTSERLQPKT